MDNYTEQIVEKKPAEREYAMLVGAILLTAAGVLITCFFNLELGVLISAAGGASIYFATKAQKSEYEYLFLNEDCDIARITNKSSRKEIYSFKGGSVKRVIQYKSEAFQNEMQINKKLDVRDFTSGIEDNSSDWYAFLINDSKEETAVVLELNEKNQAHIKAYFKNKIG